MEHCAEPDEAANTNALPPGELGEVKRAWADEGCMVPDDVEDMIQQLQEDVDNLRYTYEELKILRVRALALRAKNPVSRDVADRIYKILLEATEEYFT